MSDGGKYIASQLKLLKIEAAAMMVVILQTAKFMRRVPGSRLRLKRLRPTSSAFCVAAIRSWRKRPCCYLPHLDPLESGAK